MRKSIFTIISSIIILTGCSHDSIETKIRKQIDGMAQAVEEKNGRAFIAYLDKNYQDQGGRNRRQVRGMLAAIFLQNKKIKISYSVDKVQVQGDNVQANILVKSSAGKLFNLRSATINIQSQWKRTDGDWKLYRARWRRVDAGEAGI